MTGLNGAAEPVDIAIEMVFSLPQNLYMLGLSRFRPSIMINSRLSGLADYPFKRLDELLDGLAPPADVTPIAMSLGEPRHAAPAILRDTLATTAEAWNRYPPTAGAADLRTAIADWLARRYELPDGTIDAHRHVLPVAGTREALYLIAHLCVPPDKAGQQPAVLSPNPFYQAYLGGAVTANAEPVLVPASGATGFLPDYAALPEALLDRTALAYYCSPANPQGAVADLDTLCRLIELARRFDFTVVFDECYSEIYRDTPPPGGFSAIKALGGDPSHVLIVNSLSKRSSVPGLRSGFVAGDPDLVALFTRLRGYGGATLPLPLQAAAAALWRDEEHVMANRGLYNEKFDLARDILGGVNGFFVPAGGFFLWLDVEDGEAAARTIWQSAGVKGLPGAYIARADTDGMNPGAPYIRLALVNDIDSTKAGLSRLKDALIT